MWQALLAMLILSANSLSLITPTGGACFRLSAFGKDHWGSEKLSPIQGHTSIRWESGGFYFNLPVHSYTFKLLKRCRMERGWGGKEGRKKDTEQGEKVFRRTSPQPEGQRCSLSLVSTRDPAQAGGWMRPLNPSAQMGGPLGKVLCKCHDAMRWNPLASAQAGAQAGTALCFLQRQILCRVRRTFTLLGSFSQFLERKASPRSQSMWRDGLGNEMWASYFVSFPPIL